MKNKKNELKNKKNELQEGKKREKELISQEENDKDSTSKKKLTTIQKTELSAVASLVAIKVLKVVLPLVAVNSTKKHIDDVVNSAKIDIDDVTNVKY